MTSRKLDAMRSTTLGSKGPGVGAIGLGCMGMTSSYDMRSPRDDATSIAVIHQALGLGMTLIDTADAYGPFTNEELVGQALAGRHRDRAVLATKVGLVTDSPQTADPGNSSPGGVLPYCEKHGIAVLPFSPLGRGFLTGRFSSFDDLPQEDFRRGLPRFQQAALRANLAIVGRVREIAEQVGATPAQLALAWVLAQGRYVIPIPGTKTPTC